MGAAGHNADHRARVRKGMRFGLLTGVFIASYTVVDYFDNFVRLVSLVPALFRKPDKARSLWKVRWKYATVVGVFSLMSYVLVLYAMQVAPLIHVAPAREVSMLFAALIGGQLLGEGDRLARLFGPACMGAGVMALALS